MSRAAGLADETFHGDAMRARGLGGGDMKYGEHACAAGAEDVTSAVRSSMGSMKEG